MPVVPSKKQTFPVAALCATVAVSLMVDPAFSRIADAFNVIVVGIRSSTVPPAVGLQPASQSAETKLTSTTQSGCSNRREERNLIDNLQDNEHVRRSI